MFSEADVLQLQQFFKGHSPILRVFDRTPVTEGSRSPHIFLSHSSEDKPIVRKLAEGLNRLGVDAWLDEWEIEAGDSLRKSLGAALEKSRFIGLIITPNFLKSQWCIDEMEQAMARERRNGEKAIIPMLFSKAVPPSFIESRVYINFEKNFFQGLTKLCGMLYEASPKQVATILSEAQPTSFQHVRKIVRQFGWQNHSFIERHEFKGLEAALAKLGLQSIGNEVAITAEITERLKETGFDVTRLERLIGRTDG